MNAQMQQRRDALINFSESRAQRAAREQAQRGLEAIAADPCLNPALRDFLRAQPHAVIERGSDRWQELHDDIKRESAVCDAEDAAEEADES